ncbi:hypothetical protein DHEL01_v207047 [Diaporthe helianthi]|uniref:Uncharacterized protein n=1 Tax=Diaporthe helianthi TaxID=158607 RepID=A0A2P5HWE2_DIAHE|nr:hypothetical protein DHEL01_v207047 [Diaporthe helianthi]
MSRQTVAQSEERLEDTENHPLTSSSLLYAQIIRRFEGPKMEYFSKFPGEIQQMIWSEAMQKPGCHTFKLVHRVTDVVSEPEDNTWTLDLAVMPSNIDPSLYRWWKSLLWCDRYKQPDDVPEKTSGKKKSQAKAAGKPKVEREKLLRRKLEGADVEKFNIEKANKSDASMSMVDKSHEAFSKLANASFQAGFRKSMIQFEGIQLTVPHGRPDEPYVAAIDVATDLVILEFNRGETARAYAWFDKAGVGALDILNIRRRLSQLKRVAVHYKKSHADASKPGPFQCWCSVADRGRMECDRLKACPVEQAYFLDCLPNLEEFYYVVEVTKVDERRWLEKYRGQYNHPKPDYKIDKCADKNAPKLQLSHFYDTKYEYLQLCPRWMLCFLPDELLCKDIPLDVHWRPRDCLWKTARTYKNDRDHEEFHNPLEQRRNVKFGMLVTFRIHDYERHLEWRL